ncbi:hypothetical protein QE152_g38859 [Popillia japonica]|uniref:Uncharacterized protein n=1 Tax=Popillia japonica TaxID=7064 RepID=A0AAW1HVA1_POPJA
MFITEMLAIYSQKFGSYTATTDRPEERTTTSPPNDATNDATTEFSHPRKMMKKRRTTQPLTLEADANRYNALSSTVAADDMETNTVIDDEVDLNIATAKNQASTTQTDKNRAGPSRPDVGEKTAPKIRRDRQRPSGWRRCGGGWGPGKWKRVKKGDKKQRYGTGKGGRKRQKKIDLKKTGNKAIKLLEWEKKLLKAMEGDSNPTIGRIGGAMQMGIDEGSTQHTVSEASAMREETESAIKSSSVKTFESLLPTRKRTTTEKYETIETKGLTTKELQRLVLLEQYRTTRVQREYYEKKLERMKREDSTANVVNAVSNN